MRKNQFFTTSSDQNRNVFLRKKEKFDDGYHWYFWSFLHTKSLSTSKNMSFSTSWDKHRKSFLLPKSKFDEDYQWGFPTFSVRKKKVFTPKKHDFFITSWEENPTSILSKKNKIFHEDYQRGFRTFSVRKKQFSPPKNMTFYH